MAHFQTTSVHWGIAYTDAFEGPAKTYSRTSGAYEGEKCFVAATGLSLYKHVLKEFCGYTEIRYEEDVYLVMTLQISSFCVSWLYSDHILETAPGWFSHKESVWLPLPTYMMLIR